MFLEKIVRVLAIGLLSTLVGCASSSGPPRESGSDEQAAEDLLGAPSTAAVACSGTPGAWAGCRGNGCAVCSETTQKYPYYFANHPACSKNLTCDGQTATCDANCPPPSNADQEPAAGICNGTAGVWSGCRGNGCAVCSEKLAAYPFYFDNHPSCVRNDTCAGQFSTCNAGCPAPTDADKAPLAGTCNGSPGQWAGCRGTGCSVCSEKLTAFPNYFKNHPNCVNNTTCAGQFGTCNSNCPAPGDADRAAPAPQCSGTPGEWSGCRGNGCAVCSEHTEQYPYYFANHPGCAKNLTCDGQAFTCSASCPAPSDSDKRPAAGTCNGSPGQWSACRGDGCAVCSEKLLDYPFYFHHHPSCARNDICGGQFFTCNANCPAPTDVEKLPPAGTCNGTQGQWAGCRGTGCSVCTEKLGDYPNYFKNHPNCVKNTSCGGQFATCNSNCPAPTDSDRLSSLPDPFQKVPAATCPSAGELAISADNKWEVYVDGVRLKPTDSANLESDWRKPGKYSLSLTGGSHVLAVHAADTAGGKSGMIANLNLLGLPYYGGLTANQTRWQVLPAGQALPTNWLTAPSLPWVSPLTASDACKNLWGEDAAFKANWQTVAGSAAPRAWVWNKNCDSTQAGWQKDNWFRFVLDIQCETGSTTCPEGTACPLRDSNGATQDIGVCKAGACTASSGCDVVNGSVDAAGNLVLPSSVSDLLDGPPVSDPNVDADVGAAASATDGPEVQGLCAPTVGDLPPAALPGVQTEINKAEADLDKPLTTLGIPVTPHQITKFIDDMDDPAQPTRAKILQLAALPTPVWQQGITKTTEPAFTETGACDSERNPSDPFAGRDIIFVHGYDPEPLFAKNLHKADETKASREWPRDKEDFYSGYFKGLADAYWHDHIGRYLAGKKNRYLTVAWSTNQRLDVGVDAMLTQVSDAMRHGRGVVTAPGDLRGQVGFCVPNCVILSHSTGAPLTDIAMAIANQSPSLRFIPDHIKVHVAFEGAFGGSQWAPLALSLSNALRSVTPSFTAIENVCKLVLAMKGESGSCQIMPDFSNGVTMDLVPAVAQSLWLPLMEQTPVPTLTSTGGHSSSQFPFLKPLLPGFDDDTLTSNSTCANPSSARLGPSGFLNFNPLSIVDFGLPFERFVGYYLDQKIDPQLSAGTSIPGYAAGGCTPYLSPSGMMQPVNVPLGPPYDPRQRINNHFSFLQTAAAHSIADLGSSRDYLKGWFGSKHFEEVRVITDDSVYTNRGNDKLSRLGTDPGVLVSGAMKTLPRERVKGWSFTVNFRIPPFKRVKKTFWIWRRRYLNLREQGSKDQGDYVYENVATQGPSVPAGTPLCKPSAAIDAGGFQTCYLERDGTVRCWGSNFAGALGNGSAAADSTTPVTVSGLTDAVAVAGGDSHECALRRNGTVTCWGANKVSQLGNGTQAGESRVPISVPGLTDAVAIAAGHAHTCVLKRDGSAWCWGMGDSGELGNGAWLNSSVPVQVSNLTGAVAIAAGLDSTCAVTWERKVKCWGSNFPGGLGNASESTSPVPVDVSNLTDVVSISAGRYHLCALKRDGTVACWGSNFGGQLGNGTTTPAEVPVAVPGLTSVTSVGASHFTDHTCATKQDGSVWCWGWNAYGQLGNGQVSSQVLWTVPGPVTNFSSGAVAVKAGSIHTCALKTDGTVKCWGDNAGGALGNGTRTSSAIPVAVGGL